MSRGPPDRTLNQINFDLNIFLSPNCHSVICALPSPSDHRMFRTLIFLSCFFRSPRISEILLHR